MLIVLGKSEAAISMICDNLQSNNNFQELLIINNLNLPDRLAVSYTGFTITEAQVLDAALLNNPFVLGAANPKTKIGIHDFFKLPAEKFMPVVHRSAEISVMAAVGKGVLINSLVSVAAFTQIGNFVTINRNASVGHHSVIEDFVSINPGAVVCGNTRIGYGTAIGAGAVVIDGVTIGKNCIIGAGAVVVKDVPDNTKGFGNPFVAK